MSNVKWKYEHGGETFEYDVFSGDMRATRLLVAIEEKLKSEKPTVALFDDIIGWIDFVLGDGESDKILGKHYGFDDLLELFKSLGTFVLEEFKKSTDKYNTNNVAVPDVKPARKSTAKKR